MFNGTAYHPPVAMIHPAIPATLLALAVPAAAAVGDASWLDDGQGVVASQLTIHERVIIRLPRMAPLSRPIARPAPVAWKEKKGPKCVNPAELGGAVFGQPGYVDLVLTGNRRLRARFDGDCGALDFYSGVYLRPGGDGRICADRDAIRTRSGATCQIESFRTLVATR